jgi:RNA polymerase sigma-70 factor (ECF subfamily)
VSTASQASLAHDPATVYGRVVVGLIPRRRRIEHARAAGWYHNASDEALLAEAARRDDDQAFEQLVVRYQDRLYTFALRMLSSQQDASEAAQDAMLAAWEKRSSFRGESGVSAWLFTIARRKALDRVRARDGALLYGEAPEPSRSEADETGQSVERLDLLDALSRLPEAFREVVVLADVMALPLAEIALITGTPQNTVKTRLFRGRNGLASMLRGESAGT